MIKDNLDNLRATIAYGLALEAAGLHATMRIDFGTRYAWEGEPEVEIQITGIDVGNPKDLAKFRSALDALSELKTERLDANVHGKGVTDDGVHVCFCMSAEDWDALNAIRTAIAPSAAERAMAADVVKAIEPAEVTE